ncbi:MAG: hypothetical protein Q9172_004096 [Xanthocarpia lactea]
MENPKGDDGGENDSGGCDKVYSAVQGLCRHSLCFDVTLYRAAFGRQVQQRASGSIRVDVGVAAGRGGHGSEQGKDGIIGEDKDVEQSKLAKNSTPHCKLQSFIIVSWLQHRPPTAENSMYYFRYSEWSELSSAASSFGLALKRSGFRNTFPSHSLMRR